MSKKIIIGRNDEVSKLTKIANLEEASIIIVHGRRRAGKTSLIEEVYKKRNLIKIEGIEDKKRDKSFQIESFLEQLSRIFKNPTIRKIRYQSWREPLIELAEKVKTGEYTIFLDELQWLASYESELVSELKYIWDNYLKKNKQLILVLCGSSASFMVSEVLHSKALYNRSMHEIALSPLDLDQTLEFLGEKYNRHQALEALLCVGGIPEYLKYLKADSSVYLSFCKAAFVKSGFFVDEAQRLFVSSLANNLNYKRIVELIGLKDILSREGILKNIGLKSGKNVTSLLNDLELSGIIYPTTSYNNTTVKTKLIRYELKDPYLRFYYKFILKNLRAINSAAFNKSPTQVLPISSYYQALGYSFEHYCHCNAHRIAEGLGFAAVSYSAGPLIRRGDGNNIQLDLVFARADRVVTVCEVKYLNKAADIEVGKTHQNRISNLKLKPNQRIESVLIAPNGYTERLRASNIFDKIIGINEI
jgi:hypothetical protein